MFDVSFHQIFFEKLRIGGAEKGHPFFRRRIPSQKNVLPKDEKRTRFVRSFTQKKIQKIEEMVDIFLNSANFEPDALLALAPPSSYVLNLKALIKVLKVS